MRVISGKHKGRKIHTLKDKDKKLRPTTGMAKEALFNILSHGKFLIDGKTVLDGAVILDLYCGSGALAIESLSRGAKHVILVDIEKEHIEVARANITSIGELQNASFIRADSSNPPPAQRSCDVVFIDPPYNKGLAQKTIENIVRGQWLKDGSVVVIETSKKEDITPPEGFSELENRNYGNCKIVILSWHGKK